MLESIYRRYRASFIPVLLVVPVTLGVWGCGGEESSRGQDGQAHTASPSATTRPSTYSSGKQADDYPLTTCVVSGDRLDAMGEGFVIEHEGREVRFCCEMCVSGFKENSSKYLAILDRAAGSGGETGTEGVDDSQAGHDDHESHGDHPH